MHDDDPLLDRCPFRGNGCPDRAHAWRPGVCPDPPAGINATWPGATAPEEENDDG